MSVTITIENNHTHAREHGLVEHDRYECMFCDPESPNPDCVDCGGKGAVVFDRFPFEMNLANGNFSTLWHALGFDFDYCGSISPHAVLAAIDMLDPALVERETVQIDNVISCGIAPERAFHYIESLIDICHEAERREEQIVWG